MLPVSTAGESGIESIRNEAFMKMFSAGVGELIPERPGLMKVRGPTRITKKGPALDVTLQGTIYKDDHNKNSAHYVRSRS